MDEAESGPAGEGEGDGVGDDLSGPIFDESFIRGATRREPSADERARQARVDAEHHRLLQEKRREYEAGRRSLKRQVRSERRTSRVRKLALVVVLVVLIGAAYFSTRTTKAHDQAISYKGDVTGVATGRSPVATAGAPAVQTPATGGTATTAAASGINLIGGEPPAGVGEQAQPLGQPAAAPASPGPYKFMQTQTGTSAPVAYDPCRPIHVVINDRTEPAGGDALVQAALARASQISGLQFIIDGKSSETPTTDRTVYLPDRYPGVWAPVLVAWTDPTEIPVLAGQVAGLGGSDDIPIVGQQVYVSGLVYLDGPQMAQIMARPDGPAQAQAVIEHEVGHLVGLAHVNDPSQIMNPTSGQVTDYASGDQAGLEALGKGRCFPDI